MRCVIVLWYILRVLHCLLVLHLLEDPVLSLLDNVQTLQPPSRLIDDILQILTCLVPL